MPNDKSFKQVSPSLAALRDREYSENELTDVEIKPLITEVHSLRYMYVIYIHTTCRMQRVSWKVTCLLCLSIVVILLSIATVAITVTLLSYILVFPYHNHFMTKYTVDEGHTIEVGTVVSSIAGQVRQGLGFSWAYQRLTYTESAALNALLQQQQQQVNNVRILATSDDGGKNQFLALFTLSHDATHLHHVYVTDTGVTMSNKTRIVNATANAPIVLLSASLLHAQHALIIYSIYDADTAQQSVYLLNARCYNDSSSMAGNDTREKWQFDAIPQLLHVHMSAASWVPGRPIIGTGGNYYHIPPSSAMGLFVTRVNATRVAIMAQRDDLQACTLALYDSHNETSIWQRTFNTSNAVSSCRTGTSILLQILTRT